MTGSDDDKTGLDVIDPAGGEVTLGGQTRTIKKLTVGQLPAFARAVKPLVAVITATDSPIRSLDELTPAVMLDLVAEHTESLVKALSVATGFSVGLLNDADPFDLILLIKPVFMVNADFFRLRLALSAAMPAKA